MKQGIFFLFFCVAFLSQAQQRFTPETLWQIKRISGGVLSPDGNYVLFSQKTYLMEKNTGNTDLFVYAVADKKIVQITQSPFSEFDAQWGPNNEIYYLSTELNGVQMWKIGIDGKNKRLCSNLPKEANIEGFKLSKDGSLALMIQAIKTKRTTQDIHPDLPLANARIEDDLMYRHWDHFQDEYSRHLIVHFLNKENATTGKNIDILKGEAFDAILPPFGGSDQIEISTDNKTIYYTSKKLFGKDFATSTNSAIYAYDVEKKSTKNITESYLGYDNHPTLSPNQNQLAWLSMARNGFESDKNDIIVRDLTTQKDINVTQNLDLTVSQFIWKEDGKSILFTAAIKGTVQLFEVNVSTGKVKQITQGKFDIVSISNQGKRIVVGKQSMSDPVDLFFVNEKNGDLTAITEANKELLSNIKAPSVRERWIKTSDKKEMLAWVIYPPDFDSTKTYPTLLYCQGGPQSPVSQFFSYRWNFRLMASMGYIVIAPNRRGLPGFGQEWNDAISKDWGGQSIQDYLSAVDDLKTEKYVDASRIGAVGASYGGYSVFYLAGVHEKRFKTFISHCGLFNLESWYGTTEELFFANWDNKGPYWLEENKAYYAKNSPHRLVENWDTPIMVIQGGLDYRVPESEGMQAFQAAKLKGLESKYLYFPEENHWVTQPQNSLLWQREFFNWLRKTL